MTPLMTMTAWQIDPVQDPRWAMLVERHPRATVFHTPGWLAALQPTYGYEPAGAARSPPLRGRELRIAIDPVLPPGAPDPAAAAVVATAARVVSQPDYVHGRPAEDPPGLQRQPPGGRHSHPLL